MSTVLTAKPGVETSYPSEYHTVEPASDWDKPLPPIPSLERQLEILHRNLDFKKEHGAEMVKYPADDRADGVFVLPFLHDIGRMLEADPASASGYGRIGSVISCLFDERFRDRCLYERFEGVGTRIMRLNQACHERLVAVEARTSPISGALRYHVIPVSTGKVLAGLSKRKARSLALQEGWLPIGWAHAECILKVWPERIADCHSLPLDCLADECDYHEKESDRPAWSYNLFFHHLHNEIREDACPDNKPNPWHGGAVAFPGN